uniref:Orf-1 n=1 Tax=Micromonospora sp. SCSIO 07395 TaxID=2998119 RepID=A0A9E9EYL0_9ACTN|nr:Orf-1 [Micromonospora sp. SCSIO 07395]
MAPGRLALVQSFVNSLNVEFGPDRFATPEGYATWLARHGFPGLHPDELDRREAVALREGLRALLRENNGGPVDPAARRTVEHIAKRCPLVVALPEAGEAPLLRAAETDTRGALATVLGAMAAAVTEGSWPRLKTCHEHRCEWVYYDRSRNRGSRWCSMDVCGVRAKMRVYRDNRRQAPGQPTPKPAAG